MTVTSVAPLPIVIFSLASARSDVTSRSAAAAAADSSEMAYRNGELTLTADSNVMALITLSGCGFSQVQCTTVLASLKSPSFQANTAWVGVACGLAIHVTRCFPYRIGSVASVPSSKCTR